MNDFFMFDPMVIRYYTDRDSIGQMVLQTIRENVSPYPGSNRNPSAGNGDI